MTQGTTAETTPAPARTSSHEGERVHRLLRNSTLNLAGQGLYAVLYLVIIAALARGLGKEGFGTYYALFALMLVVQVVCEAGVSTVLTRRLAKSPEDWQKIARHALWLLAGIAIVSAGVFLILGSLWCWLRDDAGLWPSFALMGLACAAVQVQRYCAAVFAALEQFGAENVARALQGGAFAAGMSISLWLGSDEVAAAVGLFAASHMLAALFLAFQLFRRWNMLQGNREGEASAEPQTRENPTLWRLGGSLALPSRTASQSSVWGWLSESIPLGFGDVLRGLCWQVDTLLLGMLQPAAVVGIYSVAYRPLGPINWIPLSILTAVFPSFACTAEHNHAAFRQTFAASIRLLWIVSLPIGVFFCVCAETVILLLAGPAYLEAAEPMRVVIWITSLSFLSYPLRFLFTALGKSRLYARLVFLVLSLQTVVALVLIPRWGYWGACAGSILAESIFTIVGLVVCAKLGLSGIEWRALGASALAAAAMTVLLWPARHLPIPLLVLAVIAATVIYFGVCVLLGALKREELKRLAPALGWRQSGVRNESGVRSQESEVSTAF